MEKWQSDNIFNRTIMDLTPEEFANIFEAALRKGFGLESNIKSDLSLIAQFIKVSQ